MMRKRFPSYHAYAEAGMHEVLKPQERSSALTKKAEVMNSSYLENLGNGRFAMKALPAEAQIAPLYGMQSGDFNGDGIPDLLAHGNSYATEFVTGQYDALRGLLLLGQGRGRFEAVKPAASGFVTNHDGTAMTRLKSADGRMYYLLAANNDSLRLLRPMSTDQNSLRAGADIASALITYENGRVQKKEFYRGEGYLSQSSRHWTLPGGTQSVRLVSFTGDTTLLRP
jgi:hypothetical protein